MLNQENQTGIMEIRAGGGLTRREYFAGLAMQGLLADPNVITLSYIGQESVKCADALLEALLKD